MGMTIDPCRRGLCSGKCSGANVNFGSPPENGASRLDGSCFEGDIGRCAALPLNAIDYF